MATKNFKVGDEVFTVKNPSWGMKPMFIVQITGGGATCKHPEFSGNGWFHFSELNKVSKERKQSLKNLATMQRVTKETELKLFGRWVS